MSRVSDRLAPALLCAGLCAWLLAPLPGWAAPAAPTAQAAPAAQATAHSPAAASLAKPPVAPGAAAAPAAPAAQAEATALAAKVQARYQGINTLAAQFLRKSLFVAAGSDGERVVEGSGSLLWSRPASLRLQQDTPRPELILTQQGSVWWVRAERGRADVYPLERFTVGLRSLLDILGGLARVDEAFSVEAPEEADRLAGENDLTLVLKPKENRADIKRLVLWFSPEQIVLSGFRMVNVIGDITEYRFQQVQVNPPLGPETFSYQPPADYRVTDHRPQNLTGQSQ